MTISRRATKRHRRLAQSVVATVPARTLPLIGALCDTVKPASPNHQRHPRGRTFVRTVIARLPLDASRTAMTAFGHRGLNAWPVAGVVIDRQ